MFWNHIKKVSNNNLVDIDHIKTYGDTGEEMFVTNEVEKANIFSTFFSSVYVREILKLDEVFDIGEDGLNTIEEMNDILMSEEMVVKKLKQLDKNKSAGTDGIFSVVLHKCADSISNFLLKLFSFSLSFGVLPEPWKTTLVAPIYKKGDRYDVSNYRPVSLSCICCKLCESIVKEALVGHFSTNNLFNPMQYGFIKNNSTTLQLLKILDV